MSWLVEDEDTGETVAEFSGNVALDVGIQELVKLFVGQTATAYGATAEVGVGDSNSPADRGQTGLLGVNTAYKAMNPGYPQISADGFTVTFQATFGPSEALFNWQEFVVRNAGGVAFNRRVQNVGTKTGGSWRVSVIVRFAPAS